MTPQERQEGYYWIKDLSIGWIVACFKHGYWSICGDDDKWHDMDFDEIGLPCNQPYAEKLPKAIKALELVVSDKYAYKDVLRKTRAVLTELKQP